MLVGSKLLHAIEDVIKGDERVTFAFLHGSALTSGDSRDIDLAVFSRNDVLPHVLSADLKVALYRRTGLSADAFDVQVINDIIDSGDLFALIFLKNLLSENVLLVDRAPEVKGEFLERYGRKFRECEGLISEVLS
jgi:predicted nucleotidyltransferase